MAQRIYFERQVITCGNPSAIHDSTPDLNDEHIDQGYYQGENIILFFTGNFAGMLNLDIQVNGPDLRMHTADFDCVASTTLRIYENIFTVMTLPDGDHLDAKVAPGQYLVQMGRKVISSEENVMDGELPEENVTINLISR